MKLKTCVLNTWSVFSSGHLLKLKKIQRVNGNAYLESELIICECAVLRKCRAQSPWGSQRGEAQCMYVLTGESPGECM